MFVHAIYFDHILSLLPTPLGSPQYQACTSRIRDLFWKGIRVRGGSWLLGSCLFQTQQAWYTYKLTETVAAHTIPVQVQTRQNPSTMDLFLIFHTVLCWLLPYHSKSGQLRESLTSHSSVSVSEESFPPFLTCQPVKLWKTANV